MSINKNFYNTILSQALTPCGNYLILGDIYGQVWIFHLSKIISPDTNSNGQERIPKNVLTVEEDVQINSLASTENFLIVGTEGYVYGYQWKTIKSMKEGKPTWKVEVPSKKDKLEKCDVNCMAYNKTDETIYLGCADNNIYLLKIEGGEILQTLNGHTNYIHSICNIGNELVSGGEDGLVNIWDCRAKNVVNRIEPYKNDKIARPDLGKWIGAVGFNDDWLICGGGPQLSMWHLRTLNTSMIFPIDNRGIHVAEFHENNILGGGSAEFFYQMKLNGDIISEIPTSSVTIFSAIHQQQPFTVLCLAGSSPKIDICSNFNYRDQVLSLY